MKLTLKLMKFTLECMSLSVLWACLYDYTCKHKKTQSRFSCAVFGCRLEYLLVTSLVRVLKSNDACFILCRFGLSFCFKSKFFFYLLC